MTHLEAHALVAEHRTCLTDVAVIGPRTVRTMLPATAAGSTVYAERGFIG